jgi:nitrite reductase/ring-hydroxylating ferredoxin subunit
MESQGNSRRETYVKFLKEFPRTTADSTAGKMLRHYWHPVCLSGDLRDVPYPVRMLGEDLVAFRGTDGRAGLLGDRCAHRCASLTYGHIRPEGLECSYHGWTYDAQGLCTRTPLEPACSTLKNEVRQTWYPVTEWAGIVWCYMGADKENPPPLPKIDILDRKDGEVILERGDIRNYNYQNFLENFADIGHVYVLHMLAPGQVPENVRPYTDTSVRADWETINHKCFETPFGMKSVLVHDTSDPGRKFVNTWSIALPTYYRFGGVTAGLPPDFTDDRRESGGVLRIIDDEHFELFRYTLIRPGNFRSTFYPRADDTRRGLAEGLGGIGEKKPYDIRKYAGWEGLPPLEDLVLQESQGAIPPREHEHLGTSDAGVVLLRKIWRKSMENVERGLPPKPLGVDDAGVIRTDTFKGFARVEDIHLGPDNMPSSQDGRGLVRDPEGNLVFE